MVHRIFALIALTATPALAGASQADIHQADIAVATQRRALANAQRTGDAVTVAAALARLRAAEATAWGRRHPAPAPRPAGARIR